MTIEDDLAELKSNQYYAPGPDINNLTQIVPRKEWKALPPLYETPLKHPIPYVLFSITNTDPCKTMEECVRVIQEFQKQHMQDGMPDIRFNFLLSDDMNIYEGRGWYAQPSVMQERYQKKKGQILEIAYIGKLEDDSHPCNAVLKVRDALVMYGFKHKYIDESKFLKPQ